MVDGGQARALSEQESLDYEVQEQIVESLLIWMKMGEEAFDINDIRQRTVALLAR
jgi:hypothetical protein